MSTDPATLFIIGLSAVLLVWFAIGAALNRRRGGQFVHWLWQAQDRLGEGPSVRWMGTSGVCVSFAEPAEPLRQVELIAVLEPREVLLWWPVHRLVRGRRDHLVVRAQLRSKPRVNLALLDPANAYARSVRSRLRHRDWTVEPVEEPAPLLLAHPARSRTAARLGRHLAGQTAQAPIPVWVLAVNREPPHLLLVLPLPGPHSSAAEEFVTFVRQVGGHVSGGQR